MKLFYLPNVPPSSRCKHTQDAVRLVCHELGISHIDLLIVSFPGVSFDADDEGPAPEEEVSEWVRTYRAMECLHEAGKISRIGLAEFGTTHLGQVLPHARIKPSVDQINVRDCCVVPKPLILYAKERNIELLTHNDCTNILPTKTLRELVVDEFGLFEQNAVVAPQWVVKYTAVVRSRGVVENKGLGFALPKSNQGRLLTGFKKKVRCDGRSELNWSSSDYKFFGWVSAPKVAVFRLSQSPFGSCCLYDQLNPSRVNGCPVVRAGCLLSRIYRNTYSISSCLALYFGEVAAK